MESTRLKFVKDIQLLVEFVDHVIILSSNFDASTPQNNYDTVLHFRIILWRSHVFQRVTVLQLNINDIDQYHKININAYMIDNTLIDSYSKLFTGLYVFPPSSMWLSFNQCVATPHVIPYSQ